MWSWLPVTSRAKNLGRVNFLLEHGEIPTAKKILLEMLRQTPTDKSLRATFAKLEHNDKAQLPKAENINDAPVIR